MLFAVVYPEIRRFASSVADRTIDPDDLVQEAVTRVLQGGPLTRMDNPLAYLRRVVLNLVLDGNRREALAQRVGPLLTIDAEAGNPYPSDLTFLEVLAPIDRALLHLVVLEGLTVAEASETVGCSAATGRARLMRARRRVRVALKEDGR